LASSKRERELARQRAARQAARRAERERRRKQRNAVVAGTVVVLLALGAVAAAVVTNRGGSKDRLASGAPAGASTGPSSAPSGSAQPASGACSYPSSGSPARPVQPPGPDVDRTTPLAATVVTDQGEIPITLRTQAAPCTVHSFQHLASAGFFKNTPCHRLTEQGIFVLQCGDPTGTGSGTPGYSFADENLTGATYPRGTVAMANSGPNTNGSQFFLVYKDSQLPPQYTPFGTIAPAGLAVLDKIAAAGATAPDASGNTAPKTPVKIIDVAVAPAPPG
jgi:peptidyl-prolyl cis-trans isomerase B (cyclophilin B)